MEAVNTLEKYLKYKSDLVDMINIIGYKKHKPSTKNGLCIVSEIYYLVKNNNEIMISFYSETDDDFNTLSMSDSTGTMRIKLNMSSTEKEWGVPKKLLSVIFNHELRKHKIDNLLS